MFRFLIVEDIETTLEQLQGLLEDVFPNSKIDIAQTVQEGLEFIKTAWENQAPYDVAILDFQLPMEPGHNAEIHTDLGLEIKNTMPHTLVAYITSYSDDRKVRAHWTDVYGDPNYPKAILVSKIQSEEWAAPLVDKMQTYLYSAHVEEKMDALFGKVGQHQVSLPRRTVYNNRYDGKDLTHALADLMGDIVTYWDALDEPTQNRIKSKFRVDTTSRPIRISLV